MTTVAGTLSVNTSAHQIQDIKRFLRKRGSQPSVVTCSTWDGKTNAEGYAKLKVDGVWYYAHRFAYELAYGPIPPGMTVDHLCHDPAVCTLGIECPHRVCAEPMHLGICTKSENSARNRNAAKTHCKHGHEFTDENTYRRSNGGRVCRACNRRWLAVTRARQSVAV